MKPIMQFTKEENPDSLEELLMWLCRRYRVPRPHLVRYHYDSSQIEPLPTSWKSPYDAVEADGEMVASERMARPAIRVSPLNKNAEVLLAHEFLHYLDYLNGKRDTNRDPEIEKAMDNRARALLSEFQIEKEKRVLRESAT